MLKSFREVILDGKGVDATIMPATAILAFSAVMVAIAYLRFSVTDEKVWNE